MESQELRDSRRHLARCYAQIPATLARRSWNQRLQAAWKSFAAFMICEPQSYHHNTSQSDYARKIRLYPYLPPIEAKRDWLEENYRNPRQF